MAFAQGSAALEELVAERDVRVVLYLNQVEPNFRMLRFAAPVHVQIGHGESDKGSSVSNQHKAYDLTFVGGDAGRDRLQTALRGFDAEARTGPDRPAAARPRLSRGAGLAAGSGLRVWYAPTWEGDRPSIAYGSLASHGVAIVDALLADPTDPGHLPAAPAHRPGLGRARRRPTRPSAAGSTQAGDRHLIDEGEYGWQWRFADACVTDISAVAYDWLATGKPLVITEPEHPRGLPAAVAAAGRLPLLCAGRGRQCSSAARRGSVARTPDPQLAELAQYYFGDVADQASSRRFAARSTRRVAEGAAAVTALQAAEEVHVVVGRLRRRLVSLLLAQRFGVRPAEEEPADRTGQRQADHRRGPQPARHPAHRVRRGLGNLDHAVDHQQEPR